MMSLLVFMLASIILGLVLVVIPTIREETRDIEREAIYDRVSSLEPSLDMQLMWERAIYDQGDAQGRHKDYSVLAYTSGQRHVNSASLNKIISTLEHHLGRIVTVQDIWLGALDSGSLHKMYSLVRHEEARVRDVILECERLLRSAESNEALDEADKGGAV